MSDEEKILIDKATDIVREQDWRMKSAEQTIKIAEKQWMDELKYWWNDINEKSFDKYKAAAVDYANKNDAFLCAPQLQKRVETLIEDEAKRYVLTQHAYIRTLKMLEYECDQLHKSIIEHGLDKKKSDFLSAKKKKLESISNELNAHVKNTDSLISKLMHLLADTTKMRILTSIALDSEMMSREFFQNMYFNRIYNNADTTNANHR